MNEAFRPALLASFVALAACGTPEAPATRSATATIGADGGTLDLGRNVTLTVPPGALSGDRSITITRTDESAPAGYQSYSPIYRFEPRGIEFAAPVTVSLAFEGTPPRLEMIWTTAGEGGWETLGGTAAGGWLSAQVTHFSGGFVGSPDIDAASGLDGGEADSSSDDAGSESADSAPIEDAQFDAPVVVPGCPSPFAAPADSTTTVLPWIRTDSSAVDPCFAGCPTTESGTPGERTTALVTLSGPMLVTLWWNHALSTYRDTWRSSVAGDCRTSDALCHTPIPATYYTMFSRELDAGTYQFVGCNGVRNVIIEPPPPPPSNTRCGSAALVTTAAPFHQDRSPDSVPLYYRVDWTGGEQSIVVDGSMTQGGMELSLRTSCADPATEIAAYSVPFIVVPTPAFRMSSRPAGTYYVVATEVDAGLAFDMTLQTR